MGVGHIKHSKKVGEQAKTLAAKCAEFAELVAQVAHTRPYQARAKERIIEEAKAKAKSLFWEIQVRSNSLHSDDLFVDEAKTGGDNG